jgi:tripartite-type tricarboxylate transporter receptor subunit TctC
MEGEIWAAVYAPSGTPREDVVQMRDAILKVVSADEWQTFLGTQGALPMNVDAAGLLALTRSETDRFAPIVRRAKMKLD